MIDVQGRLKSLYEELYFPLGGRKEDFDRLLDLIKRRRAERSADLKVLDQRPAHWYMSEKMVGMMLYVDLFAGDLKSLPAKIPYLQELGITYVHLMPLLKPRPGESDGGYAVEDYLDIDPRLGNLDDFIKVLQDFRQAGIDVCIDYVLNHTANTHEWALKAKQGDRDYQDYYLLYEDRSIPDQYDQTVAEVLPDKHPGNFTYEPSFKKWVFTSFSDFQWDLNYKNPKVFEEMVDIMLHLANYGVTILRLDAIAFMWKELGTSCRNLKEVHKILAMLHLIKEMVCPALALLGEAIVEPHEIVKYFGQQEQECGLLYNANFMVNIFNAFATKDTRLMQVDNMRFHLPDYGCFMNYVRCHDDIGWGLNEEGLQQLGMDPFLHKEFLNEFYSGDFKGSFARGERYQYNPITHDARMNGTLASLLGLEKAVDFADQRAIDEAIHRILLAHGLILQQRGIPLLYSGDEIAMLNDYQYGEDPHKAVDSRWMHRPVFDWERAEGRKLPHSIVGRVFNALQQLIIIRKGEALFNGGQDGMVLASDNKHLYLMVKDSGSDHLIGLYNFSEYKQSLATRYFTNQGYRGRYQDLVTQKKVDLSAETIDLYPYEFLWLKKA